MGKKRLCDSCSRMATIYMDKSGDHLCESCYYCQYSYTKNSEGFINNNCSDSDSDSDNDNCSDNNNCSDNDISYEFLHYCNSPNCSKISTYQFQSEKNKKLCENECRILIFKSSRSILCTNCIHWERWCDSHVPKNIKKILDNQK